MLKDSIVITGFSYKLEEWEELIIKRCIEDNPSFSLEELAEMLGMAFRTFTRKLQNYDIDASLEYRKTLINNLKTTYETRKGLEGSTKRTKEKVR